MKQGYDVTGDPPRDLVHRRPRTDQMCHPWLMVTYPQILRSWKSVCPRKFWANWYKVNIYIYIYIYTNAVIKLGMRLPIAALVRTI